MNIDNFVIDALERVLTWDLSDDACLDAVATQARLMAGLDSEEFDSD
jgi:hypothetical protein